MHYSNLENLAQSLLCIAKQHFSLKSEATFFCGDKGFSAPFTSVAVVIANSIIAMVAVLSALTGCVNQR